MNNTFGLILLNFNFILPPLMAIVIAVKLTTFFRYKAKHWKMINLLYFQRKQIATAKSFKLANIKIISNALSFYLVFLIVFYAVLLFMQFQ